MANVPRGAGGISDEQQKMLAAYVHADVAVGVDRERLTCRVLEQFLHPGPVRSEMVQRDRRQCDLPGLPRLGP
jgi:hypothetical protein